MSSCRSGMGRGLALGFGLAAMGCVGAGTLESGDVAETVAPDTFAPETASQETASHETVDPFTTSFASVGATLRETTMSGWARFRDAPDPSGPVTALAGLCRMREAVDAFCDPPCASGALCTGTAACADDPHGPCIGACTPFATPLSAGTVTLETRAGTTTLVAVPGFDTYYSAEPVPLVEAGAEVTVVATGDTFPAFEAHLTMVPALVLANVEAITVTPGEALTIRWTPADPASRVRVLLEADLDHGFVPRVRIECDAPDAAGEIVVPVAMVDALADPTHWGCGRCPTQRIQRYVRTTLHPSGKSVDFELQSERFFFFRP